MMIVIIQLFIEVALFLLAVLCLFYLPGKFFTRLLRLSLDRLEEIFFSLVFGLIIFTLISFTLASLKLSLLLLPFYIVVNILVIKKIKKLSFNLSINNFKHYFLIFCMAGIFSLTMVLSGEFGDHIRLVEVNNRDSLWHLSLINELKFQFPPDNPGFANVPLKGYHFFYDFLLATVSSLSALSPLALYFHLFPPFTALLWGFGVYTLMKTWIGNKTTALWAVFLSFFGGSFVFVLLLWGIRGISLDYALGMAQPASILINPPMAISIVLLVFGLYSLLKFLKTTNNAWIMPLVLSFGLLSEFKIYAGIIALGGFAVLMAIKLLQKKYIFLFIFVGILVLFFFTYWSFTGSSGYLIFYPLWPPREMINSLFPEFHYTEQMQIFVDKSNYPRIILLKAIIIGLFVIGNLGTRIFGLLTLGASFLKKKKYYSDFGFIFFVMLCISFFIPMFFIQSIKVFETKQMFYYFLFFSSLLSAIGINQLFTGIKIGIRRNILIVIFIVATLPSAYQVLSGYLIPQKDAFSTNTYNAFQFLKKQGEYHNTVLELPPKQENITKRSVRQWYDQQSTPRVLAFSNKRGYSNNEFIDFPGIDLDNRLDIIVDIMSFDALPYDPLSMEKQKNQIVKELNEKNVRYIYSPNNLSSLEKLQVVKKIYHNNDVNIYLYDK